MWNTFESLKKKKSKLWSNKLYCSFLASPQISYNSDGLYVYDVYYNLKYGGGFWIKNKSIKKITQLLENEKLVLFKIKLFAIPQNRSYLWHFL